MPVVVRAFFRSPPEDDEHDPEPEIHEAPLLCVLPPVLTGIGCVVLFFYADDIYKLLTGIMLR
jgi:multicomponent Na+:H+ antiporter subunit D